MLAQGSLRFFLLIYLSAAACISGGTMFGRMLTQEYVEGQSCKKRV